MNKPGPTPKANATRQSIAERQEPSQLLDVAIPLPRPPSRWLAVTRDAFLLYAASDAARVLREEDLLELGTMFELIDQRARYVVMLASRADDQPVDESLVRSIKTVDSMIARMAGNLGVGPLARTRLGISLAERKKRERADTKAADATPLNDF